MIRILVSLLAILFACSSPAESGGEKARPTAAVPAGEWRYYGADAHSSKYSPLTQINRNNVRNLRVAWRWSPPDNALLKLRKGGGVGPNESTPIMVRGTIYTSTGMNLICAIDPSTGKQKWVHNPNSGGSVHRGVAYWESGKDRRIVMATRDSFLIALSADTGKPIKTFGHSGRVDLTEGLRRPVDRSIVSHTSPPIVVGDVIVVGGAVDDFQDKRETPPGDVRGFDVRTGKQLWVFQSIPQPGEFGNETWEKESWKYSGNTNVWAVMSADPELGYVYLPFGTANDDWYGGHRPGANLFSESLVCLDAKTGRRVWHFQMVHHGLWDYDLPCAPNLIDVTVDGKRIKAIAQVSKQAFCYVFDRETGRPLWPIEERPVPQRVAPGDVASPTQPFPTKPAPFDLQNAVEENLINFTPELRAEAGKILDTWHHGPLYTPPLERRTMLLPGWVGGASWAGASTDPETGILYVPSVQNAMWLNLQKPESPNATVDFKIKDSGHDIPGPKGLPLFKPPWGRITAINLSTGDHQWMSVVGDGPRNHPALKHLKLPKLGINRRIYTLTTKTLLLAVQEGAWFNEAKAKYPPKLWAFDKATGKQLAEVSIPAHATGAPMTYFWKGKQYIAIPTGGAFEPSQLVTLSLP